MNKNSFLSVITMLSTVFLHAQMIQLKGKPVDSTGKSLEGATVRLYKDSVAIRQARSGNNGFVFGRLGAGRYELKISFVGYKDLKMPVTLKGKDSVVALSSLIMLPTTDLSLLEVVVKATVPPVFMKNDTLVYNASAYKLRPYASVEDLLKKLPGVSVDKDGRITLNGKKVDKIYVDGKEFMLNDPKVITQGFNADMLAAVEAFDNTSEDKRFMGLKDGNAEKAINLKLKKEYRNSAVGKANAGISQEPSRYKGGLQLTKVAPESLITAVASVSAINEDIYQEPVTGPYIGLSRLGGDMRHSEIKMNYSTANRKILSGYSLNDDLRSRQTVRDRETFLNDSSILQHSESTISSYRQEQLLDIRGNIKIDSVRSLEIVGYARYSHNEAASNSTSSVSSKSTTFYHSLSEALSYNLTNGNFYGSHLNLSYRRRFKRTGRFMIVNFNGGATNAEKSDIIRNTLVSGGTTQSLNQISQEKTPNINFGMSASYSQPIAKGKVIDINYGINYLRRQNNKEGFNYNPVTGKYDLTDTTTTNQILAKGLSQNFAIGYDVAGKIVRYQIGIAAQDERSENDVIRGSQQSFAQHVHNWIPRASVQWQFKNNGSFQLDYFGLSQPPSIEQLQPLPDLRNPLLVRVGNPDLSPQFDHTVKLSYSLIKPKLKRATILDFTLKSTDRKLTQSVKNLPGGVQEIRFENLNGSFDLSADIKKDYSVGAEGVIKFGTALHYGEEPGFVNGQISKRSMLGVRPDVEIFYSPIERLSMHVEGTLDFSNTIWSVGDIRVIRIIQIYSMNSSYEFPGNWHINGDFSYQRYSGGTGLPVLENKLLNASVSKRVFKNKSGLVKFTSYDILKSIKGVSQQFTEQSIETSTTKAPDHLFLLSISWNFKSPSKISN